MALKIRLRQQGKTNRQTYRLVVTDIRSPRDGKYLEMLGWYNPFNAEEKQYHVDADRVLFWLDRGAQLSSNVASLLKKAAPDVVKGIKAQVSAKRVKEASKRRTAGKKA